MTSQNMQDAETIELQFNEWQYWKALCYELRSLGVDINKQNRLCNLIKNWGESLSELRINNKQKGIANIENLAR